MNLKKNVAFGSGILLVGLLTALCIHKISTSKDSNSQENELMNSTSVKDAYDYNCNNRIDDLDKEMMKSIASDSTSRYLDNMFTDIDKIADVVYAEKEDSNGDVLSLKLDLYQPQNDTQEKRPVIIWVHGGGLYTGSKDSDWDAVTILAPEFAHKGYVCISIDYRLTSDLESDVAFTEAMRNAAGDVASAIEWVRQNEDAYSMSSDYIVLAGYSAGAEIVDNMYYSNSIVSDSDFDKSGVKAVVSISGNRLFYDSSVVSGDKNTKCLVLHGDADDINPYADAQRYMEQLGEQGILQTLTGNSHTWTQTNEQKEFLISKISEYLVQNMFTL